MAGDAANAALWTNADVYIAPLASTEPTDVTTAWAAAWEPVGLLDGDEGFTESREEESNDFYAWGGLLVKRTKAKHKRTIKFVALEDNDTVFALINPGSTRSTTLGVTTADVKVPTGAEFAIGFQTTDGDKIKRRVCSRAEVQEVGEVKDSESGLTVYEITVLLYPDSSGVLYTDITGAAA
jgi:hypothetical protein